MKLRGETIPLKLKLELCETSKFLHIIICKSDNIFAVYHSRRSSYNIMYWRSLNGQIWLTGEENMLFQVFNIPIQYIEYRKYIVTMSISNLLLNFHDVMDAESHPLLHTYCSSGGTSFDRCTNSIEFIFTFSLHT